MSRPATVDDLPALADLEIRLFGQEAWSRAALEDEVGATDRRFLVETDGTEDGIVVGYAVTLLVAGVADLVRIAVHPEWQRRGTARTLLDEVLATAQRDGADRMLLEVAATNSAALALYASAGFVEIDRRRRYYKDGSDAIVMRRSLARACSWG